MARNAKSAPVGVEKPKRGAKRPDVQEVIPAAGARWGRKPKMQELAEATASLAEPVKPPSAPADSPAIEEPPKARRGRKPKQVEAVEHPQPDMDATIPEDDIADVPITVEAETPKARRGRKPKAAIASERMPIDHQNATAASPSIAGEADAPRHKAPVPNNAASQGSAAHWDRAAGRVTFDWPAIERTAAEEGPNQAMAKLLIAARAEGTNSRWPF